MMMFAPACAKASAMAWPIPESEPVIRAILLSSFAIAVPPGLGFDRLLAGQQHRIRFVPDPGLAATGRPRAQLSVVDAGLGGPRLCFCIKALSASRLLPDRALRASVFPSGLLALA